MGEIVSIVSGKGGVGKSTVAALLGAALARRGKMVLLIDCDVGLRSLDLVLSVARETVFDLADVLEGNCPPARAICAVPAVRGLHALAAPQSFECLERTKDIARLVKGLSLYYDYIILDSPAGIGSGFSAAVSAANKALVVVTPDAVSIRDGFKVGRILKEKGIESRLVVNKVKADLVKKGVSPNLDEIIDQTGIKLIAAIPEDEEIALHVARGDVAPGKSPGFVAISNLALRMEGERVPLSLKLFK